MQQNATALQRKLSERNKLLSQLDQAKMQEQVNKAMASLSETVGEDVPTFDEVREKIEARYAKAKGMSELTESSVESRMLEVEQAAANSEAQTRLAQIRAQLGLAPAAAAEPEAAAAAEPRHRAGDRHRRRRFVALTAARRGRRGGRPRGACPRAARRCDGRPRRAGPPSPRRTSPLANTAPSRPAISTASSISNAPFTRDDAGGQQRHAALEQGPARAVVDDDRAARPDRERDPQLAGGQALRLGVHHRAGAGRAGHRRLEHPVARGLGDHGPHARTTPRSWRRPASRPSRRSPAPCRCPRPATRASGRPRRSPR